MELYGSYLSPFVRRAAITMQMVGIPYELVNLRVFDTPEPVRAHNPMARIPTLVLDDGAVLVESGAILDEIDQMVGPERALTPASGPTRRAVMQLGAFGVGVMDKAQWAFYERRFHPEEKVHEPWEKHNDDQVVAGLKHLDGFAAKAGAEGWLAGTEQMTQADVSVAVAYSFAKKVRPLLDLDAVTPALAAFTARCEELPAFKACPLP